MVTFYRAQDFKNDAHGTSNANNLCQHNVHTISLQLTTRISYHVICCIDDITGSRKKWLTHIYVLSRAKETSPTSKRIRFLNHKALKWDWKWTKKYGQTWKEH